MAFLQKYQITQRHLPQPSARRRGYPMFPGVRFVVAHDTGNPNSTAAQNVAYFARTANPTNSEISSVHFFVDDTHIIECVPVLNCTPEKAWHVLSTAQGNNRLFGFHANDAAVGIEYCFGTNIHADQAYRRYVWLIAYVCYQFQLDPSTAVVGHFMLDPHRKTDPVTGLAHSRRNYEQLLRDVVSEHAACSGTALPAVAPSAVNTRAGSLRVTVRLHIRHGSPNTMVDACGIAEVGTRLDYFASVSDGESVNGNTTWYKNKEGNYFWSGGTASLEIALEK